MPSVCCSTLACPLSPKSCGSNCPSSNPSQIPTANSKTTPTGASQTSSSQQASGSDKVSIIVWPYPEMQQSWPNPEAEDQIQTADSILRAVRKLRNDYRNYRLQRQRPELFIQCTPAARASVLHTLTEVVGSLTSCSEVKLLQASPAAPAGYAPAVVDDVTTVQLLLAGILDPSKEIDKLQREKALQGRHSHSLQQAPAPKTGSTAGEVQILASAATAPLAAPLLAASAAHTRQVRPGIPVQHPPLRATDAEGRTPLHIAASSVERDAAELLLARGADINAKDCGGRTALHCAATWGCADVAELLLSKGADVHATADWGTTPLHEAIHHGHTGTAAILLSKGADVHARCKQGQAPLHAAAIFAGRDVTELLLARGADINAKDYKGKTALDWAQEHGRTAVVELLRQK